MTMKMRVMRTTRGTTLRKKGMPRALLGGAICWSTSPGVGAHSVEITIELNVTNLSREGSN